MRKSLILTVTVLSTLLVFISFSLAGVQQAMTKAKNFDVIDSGLPKDNSITQGKIKWLETFNDTIPPANWQIIDNDGSGSAWTFVQGLNFQAGPVNPEAGQSFYWSSFNNANGFLIDEWLITPKLPVIEAGDSLHFYAGAIDGGFDDSLKVWISTTDSLPGSFTQIAYFKVAGPLGAWNRYSFDLTPYVGSQIFVAVNYYIVNGGTAGAASDNIWVDHFVLEGIAMPKILISEFVVTPTEGEYIEIYNPNAQEVDLTDYYLTDATFAGGNTYYYQIVEGGGGGGGFADFHSRFPTGASINPGEYQTIALAGDSLFFEEYGVVPTYELFEDSTNFANDATDMLEPVPGSVNGQGGLTDGDEVIIIYYWDGLSDLVQDADYVIYNSGSPAANNEAVDKTGVSIDGPDADTLKSTYLNDTPIASQMSALNHNSGFSVHRIDYKEGMQNPIAGNGITGANEMSEDLNNTFTNLSKPSPNGPYVSTVEMLNPPRDLQADAGDAVVDLSWLGPLPFGELGYDDGTPETGFGFSGTGEFAVRFTPNMYPAKLLGIKTYWANITDPLNEVQYAVYTNPSGGDNPPTALVAGPTADTVQLRGQFSEVDISAANIMVNSGDFFYSWIQPDTFNYGIGLDRDSPNAERSWISFDGVSWNKLSAFGFENIMIRALVQEGAGANARIVELAPDVVRHRDLAEIKSLRQQYGHLFDFDKIQPGVVGDILSNSMGYNGVLALLGYEVFRSTDSLNFSSLTTTDTLTLNYSDNTVTNNTTYYYRVTANYDEGTSDPSNVAEATPFAGPSEAVSDHVTAAYVGTVTNEGNIGWLNSFPPAPGSGFMFNPATSAGQRLFEGAVMIGVSDTLVSDAARDENQNFDADFQFLAGFDSSQSVAPVTVYETSYSDDLAETPIGVVVTQTTFSVDTVGGDGILLFQFDITNISGADLPVVHVGGFFDWDVNPATAEDLGQVVVDSSNTVSNVNGGQPFFIEVVEMHQGSSPDSWVGVVPLSSNVFAGRRVLISSAEVYPPRMTTADKWTYMTQNRATNPNGGSGAAQDHAQVFGLPAVTISDAATQRVGFAIVAGTSLSEIVAAAREAQRIWVEGLGNDMVILEPTGIEDQLVNIPLEYALHQNYPNPFNPTTTIRYDLKQNSDVTLRIFNMLGQEVRTLVNGSQEAGYKDVVWDGLNNSGARVASGIYIYRIEAGEFIQSRKMILMK